MARSSYIYIVEDSFGALAAFTVKYELESYMKTEGFAYYKRIVRVSDGNRTRYIVPGTYDHETGKVKFG